MHGNRDHPVRWAGSLRGCLRSPWTQGGALHPIVRFRRVLWACGLCGAQVGGLRQCMGAESAGKCNEDYGRLMKSRSRVWCPETGESRDPKRKFLAEWTGCLAGFCLLFADLPHSTVPHSTLGRAYYVLYLHHEHPARTKLVASRSAASRWSVGLVGRKLSFNHQSRAARGQTRTRHRRGPTYYPLAHCLLRGMSDVRLRNEKKSRS